MKTEIIFPLAWYLLLEQIAEKHGTNKAYSMFKMLYNETLLNDQFSYIEGDWRLNGVLDMEEGTYL